MKEIRVPLPPVDVMTPDAPSFELEEPPRADAPASVGDMVLFAREGGFLSPAIVLRTLDGGLGFGLLLDLKVVGRQYEGDFYREAVSCGPDVGSWRRKD